MMDFPEATLGQLLSYGIKYCPSVYDSISARMASSLGFRIGILGGSVASLRVAGAPDANVLTATELVEQARRTCSSTNLHLIVDADGGYGNALNVIRTVQELEAAGVAAVSIEDTYLPQPFGPKTFLISEDEAVAKLEAAASARAGPNMSIIARTHALRDDLDGLLRRVWKYSLTGADIICVTGVETLDQLRGIKSQTDLPIFLLSHSGSLLAKPGELEATGVRLWADGHAPYYAGLRATYEVLKAQAEGNFEYAGSLAASKEFVSEFSQKRTFDLARRSYLEKSEP